MLGCSFLVFSVYNKNMKTKRIKRILPLCLLLFGCSSTEQVGYRSAKMDLLDSVVFEEKDILEFKGVRYKIAGAPVKPDGITGVTPKRGQHAEYNLVYTQEGL